MLKSDGGIVAPLAGAWIEIRGPQGEQGEVGSLPSRERGLKLRIQHLEPWGQKVAPLAGAWIEIASG